MTPGEAAAALAALSLPEVLQAQAELIAGRVRDSLGHAAGSAHEQPWRQTGALGDSIAASCDGLRTVVGSNDPAAAPQELGTATVPPRPFLAPAAAGAADGVAHAAGTAAAEAIARRLA